MLYQILHPGNEEKVGVYFGKTLYKKAYDVLNEAHSFYEDKLRIYINS